MQTLATILGWLFRASWQASVLVGVVLLVQALTAAKLPARWRHALWWIVLIRLVLPFAPESRCSLFNLPALQAPAMFASLPTLAGRFERASAIEAVPAVSAEPRPTRVVAVSWDRVRRAGWALGRSLASPHGRLVIFVGWAVGVLGVVGRVLWESQRLALAVVRRRPVTDSGVLDVLEDCKALMGIYTPMAIIESPLVSSPSLHGFVRPRLLVPLGFVRSFSSDELRHVFLHELAHLRRGDIAAGWLLAGLQALHWFNPLVWLAFHRLRADRELAADEMALWHLRPKEAQAYGGTVLKLLETFSAPVSGPALVGILEDQKQMVRRIRQIARFGTTRKWLALALVVLVVVAVIGLTDARSDRPASPSVNPDRSTGTLP